jgi:hypothetical protein
VFDERRCIDVCDSEIRWENYYDDTGVYTLMVVSLQPVKEQKTFEYSIVALDMIIGTVGGFISLVYMFFNCFLSDFEEFRRDLSLVESFYSTENPDKKP